MPSFDYQKAKTAGYNDQEIADYLKQQKASGVDIWIDKNEYAQTSGQTEQPKEQGFLGKVKDFGVDVVKSIGDTASRMAIRNLAEPFDPTGQLVKQLPEKVNLPIIGETSLRYSDKPIEKLKQMGGDILNVLPGGAETKSAIKLAEQGSKGLAGKLIQSAFKITANDLKKSPELIKDFLVERLASFSKGGMVKKTDSMVDALENQLDDVIAKAEQQGKTVNAKEIVKSTKDLIKQYENSAFPEYADIVKQKVAEFVKKGKISIKEAQEFKKNTYAILRKEYGKLSAPAVETAKQITRGVKEAIEQQIPEIKKLGINKKLAIYGKARDLMLKRVRSGGNELLPFKDIVLTGATQSLWPTLARLTIESVPFKTYIAKMLTSTKTQVLKNIGKISAPVIKEATVGRTLEQEPTSRTLD
jgi:hypothetical protein